MTRFDCANCRSIYLGPVGFPWTLWSGGYVPAGSFSMHRAVGLPAYGRRDTGPYPVAAQAACPAALASAQPDGRRRL